MSQTLSERLQYQMPKPVHADRRVMHMPGAARCDLMDTSFRRHDMTRQPTGLYRTKGTRGCPNDVRLSVSERSFYITEAEYRRRECLPDFEDLTWQAAA